MLVQFTFIIELSELVTLLALTTPVNGQNFLKKLKDAANNASDKMNTAVEKTGNASANVAVPTASGPTYYVSRSGSNKNDGLSPSTAVKNIQKAIDLASDGSEIRVAEGNYFGLLNKGNIIIDKPLVIMGGYNADFTERDVLKYLTTIAPDDNSNGSSQGRGTIQIRSIEKPSSSLVIDGLIFNKGNAIGYNLRGEGWPEGVETPFMMREGSKGQGGPNLENKEVYTQETYFIYFDGVAGKVNNLNVFIRNCTFVNGPNTTICGLLKGSLTVDNCAFINNRVTTMDVRGPDPNAITKVNFLNNTVLFVWSYTKDLQSQGFGFRFQPGTSCTLENNIFFLNRITDLTIPGGGMLTRVKVEDFDGVEAIAECSGNKSLTDPALFKGKIDEPYLNGFLSVSYKETTSYNPNSAANTFRSAMGMNMTGTMSSSVSMYFNRYPWQKALDVFGAVPGCGAQIPR